MIAQRVGVSAARRAVAAPSTFFTTQVPRLALSTSQIRPLGTAKLTPAEGQSILAAQRLQRPVSPHLTAYRLDQTWFGASIWTRITGGGLSAALYVYLGAYVAAPLLGWHIESAAVAAAFGTLPIAIKGGLKFLVAWPFMFHCLNGIRHLTYDLGMGYAKKQIHLYGWAIWSTSLVAGLYTAFLW
ncbi:hypothetical protein ACHAQH_008353 [Verticillium albo-atrum]